jgi:branched-chain amino acid aminotransferase
VLFPRAWVGGRIVPLRRAVLRSDDRALLFGLGAFETIRLYSGVPFDLDAHLARMRQTLRALGLDSRDLTEPRLRGAIASLSLANRIRGDVAVRITLAGGPEGGRGHLIVQARTLDPDPDRLRARGARLVTAPWQRVPAEPLRGHKTLIYLEHLLARAHARRHGGDEAIYVDPRGRILEGSFSSVFVARRGRVSTPPLAAGILPGITRARVCRIVRSLGIPFRERTVTRRELVEADEAFLTSSSNEVLPVDRLDGRRLRRGELWRRVWVRYRAQVEREVQRREGRR